MSFKDAWQNFLTKIDNRIPIKKITGPLDKKNPLTSFFIFLLIILVVLYLIFGSSITLNNQKLTEVTIRLADSDNNILDNFDFKIRNISDGITNSYVTNSSGSLTLELDLNKKYLLIIDSPNYELLEEEINLSLDSLNFIVTVLDTPINYLKTVYFEDALTNSLIEDSLNVTIRCDNGEIITPNTIDTQSGSVEINVPLECENIYASVRGDRYIEENLEMPITESTFKLESITEILESGRVSISVFSGEDIIQDSITIKIFSVDDSITPINTTQTTNGIGFFNSIPVGEYIVKASDVSNRYLQKQEQVTIIKNSLSEITFDLIDTDTDSPIIIDPDTNQEIVIREVTVFVKDKDSGEIIDSSFDPSVTLLLDGNENIEQRNLNEGFIFNISEDKSYSLKATAEGYIPGEIIPIISGKNTYIFNLEKITISNVSNLNITVQDEDLKPIVGLKSWIYDKDGQYIDPRFDFSTSDENGNIVFENIPDLNFTIKVKNSFIEETSSMYHNSPPEDTNITLPVEIGTGTVNLTVKNKLNDIVSNAQVTFYSESLEVLGSSFASSNGTLENDLKADKRIFIKIEADGYLPYFTELFRIYKNKTVTKEIILERENLSDDVSVEFLGLYNSLDTEVESLKNNEVFYFKFKAIMPVSSQHFNFVFRAGSFTSVTEDIVFIMPQNTSLGIPVYYENEPFNESGNYLESKLVDIEFLGYPASVHEITIPIRIKNAAINERVSFFYDSSINNIDFMSNNFNQLQYFIEATSLCGEDFCFSGQYVDVSQDLRYDISSNNLISTNIHSDYILEYQITNSSSNSFEDVRLSTRNLNNDDNPVAMININSYSISGEATSVGQTIEGENNFNIPFTGDEINLEKINPFSSINYTLNVTPLNLGQSKLTNRIISLQEEIYSLPINFSVSELETMEIDYEPKNIVPGLPFDLLVTVKDTQGEYLEGVNINILQKVRNEYITVSTGKTTDPQGNVIITLPSLRPGETFEIQAIKSKYFSQNVSFTIGTDILDVYSQEQILSSESPLEVFIHKTNINGETYSLTLKNKTNYALKINQFNTEDFSFNKSYLLNLEQTVNYLNNQITSQAEGFVIPANESKEIVIKFAPSDSARTHPVSEDILGAITGNYSLNNYDYRFTIPVKAKFSVGSGVLFDDCLVVTQSPGEWNTVVSTSTQTTSFTIKNTCLSKEGEVPIPIKNVQAKISSQADRYGVYFLNLIGPSSSNQIQLSENYYRVVIDQMAPEEEYRVDLTFNTNGTRFADVKTNIHLNAQVETEDGLSFVNKEPKDIFLKTNISIMNLNDCFSYIDQNGKVINSGGLYTLEGIEENELTIRNNCQGKATFKMNLCDAYDLGCNDLIITNTDEENNILRFSLNDSEKTVYIKKDSTKAPGAYILNNRVSVINNFERELASSFALLKINAKDPNGLWMEDPFIEINEDKVSEIKRLYNNNLEKTPWDYASYYQGEEGFGKFITNIYYTGNTWKKSFNQHWSRCIAGDDTCLFNGDNSLLSMRFLPENQLSNVGAEGLSAGGAIGIGIGTAAIVSLVLIMAKVAVLGSLLGPVGWIVAGLSIVVASIAPSFFSDYDVDVQPRFLDVSENNTIDNLVALKEISVDDLSDQKELINVFDITGARYFKYFNNVIFAHGKLASKKEIKSVLPKCNGINNLVPVDQFLKVYNKPPFCDEITIEETEDSYIYKTSCNGQKLNRLELNLFYSAYSICKSDETYWPEQAGIKPLQFNLTDEIYNLLDNDSKKYYFKKYEFNPTLDDSNSTQDLAFVDSDSVGNYRFGFFLTKPEETPNYDLSLQECVTDTGRTGKTGEGAVPNISLNWNWAETDCAQTYCDATQLTQDVLDRINDAEKLISSNVVQCPISNQELYDQALNGSYKVTAEPSDVINEIPVGKVGINSVKLDSQNNKLAIKVVLENRSDTPSSGTIVISLDDKQLESIKYRDVASGEYIEENIDYPGSYSKSITVPSGIDNTNEIIFVYKEGIYGEDLPLTIDYLATNSHSNMFASSVDLSSYQAEEINECQVPATTARFDGTSYLDMWLNKEMYPDNVVGSGWSQTDITKLKELLEFDAYLITDNYNSNFKNDFDMAFGGLASKEDGAGAGNYAIMSSPTVFSNGYLSNLFKNNLIFTKEYSSEENVNINVPGKYKIKIDLLFENGSWNFYEGDDLDVNAFVTFRFISSPETDSVFYRMPFNGFVGKTTSGYDRQGYGVSYLGDSIRVDNENVITEEDYGSNSLRTITVTKSNDLSRINSNIETRGNLLSIKYNQTDNVDLIFTPSTPIPLLMSIDKSNNSPLNVIYRLKDKSGNAISSTSLLRWTGVGSGCDFSGNSIYNMTYYDRYAGDEGAVSAYVVDWPQVLRTGKIYLRTVFYSPERESYSLENRSDQGVMVKFSKNGTNYSSSVSLGEDDLTGIKSISDVFNLIKDNKVCVVNSYDGKTSDFFYNPSEIFTEKFTKQPSDSLECS